MKKLILLTALLLSVVYGKSVEQLQSEWIEKYSAITQKQSETFSQYADVQRLAPHCENGDIGACRKLLVLQNKHCQNGFAALCADLAEFAIKIDENKAKYYADKVCSLDAVICVYMSGLFSKNRKLSLKYAEKACEMGESIGCAFAFEAYSGQWESKDIKKDIKKAKYYSDKLCKAGVKEACE